MAHIVIDEKDYEQLKSKVDLILCELKEIKSSKNQIRNEYIDITEAAKALGISERTLHKRKAEKSIPFLKKGGKIYFKTTDIRDYLETNSEN